MLAESVNVNFPVIHSKSSPCYFPKKRAKVLLALLDIVLSKCGSCLEYSFLQSETQCVFHPFILFFLPFFESLVQPVQKASESVHCNSLGCFFGFFFFFFNPGDLTLPCSEMEAQKG